MTKKAMEIGKSGRIIVEDLIFLIRKDPKKYSRVKELLLMNEELRKLECKRNVIITRIKIKKLKERRQKSNYTYHLWSVAQPITSLDKSDIALSSTCFSAVQRS
ncbi:hypothetical protein RRG08_046557 [Elysia crispata]|uniref:Uncharacterized protein n=1 Tax=Elysia crispata TaxID=231223 RepID=A0AAE1E2D0_9GAST|nr:hypothetical protein RRG08_046557 [Elysia crispata]KAK3791403.1 hypothetical protein RRG08_046557 [Elysia crispata]